MGPGRLLPPWTSLPAGLVGLASMDTAAGHRLLGREGKLKIQFNSHPQWAEGRGMGLATTWLRNPWEKEI